MVKFGELQLSDAQPRQGCRPSRRSPQRRSLALEPRFGRRSTLRASMPSLVSWCPLPAHRTSHISYHNADSRLVR
jgi:hypothetical protein